MTDKGNPHLEILISAIKAKDKNAFNLLYDETINRVFSLALKITQSDNLAEEVVSDVYFQVWQQAEKYKNNLNGVVAWLMMLCRSRALDCLRKQKRTVGKEQPYFEDNDNRTTQQPDILESIDTKSAIFSALSQLDTQQQQLLSLAYFKGYSHNELATFTGLPLGTIKTTIRRSLILMQDYLQSFEA